ncbi:MAG TPA: glycosyltransferase family A protein [Candidatus Lokiarchaeia archaeon]|nr:glycosyltransferase family A protein [Candidatus Lokiarchaeia archaeon]
MNTLISVIIPTFNRANLIPLTIKSVLNQTYSNLEILVIDDGSTDDTERIVKSIKDERIRYYKIVHKGFPAPARNRGITEAHGEYIAMLDSDDLWVPRKLELQIKPLQSNPNLVLISTNFQRYPGGTKPELKLRKNTTITFKKLISFNIIVNSSVLFRKNIVDKIGFLDEGSELKSVEDFDYWLRILHEQDKSILIMKDILTIYRIHEKNISDISQPLAPLKELKYLLHIYNKYINEHQDIINNIIRKKLSFSHYNLMKFHLVHGDIKLITYLKEKNLTPYYKIKGILFILILKLKNVFQAFMNSTFE